VSACAGISLSSAVCCALRPKPNQAGPSTGTTGGGGGGSSYLGSASSASIFSGSGTSPGNSADGDRSGAGDGGAQRTAGADGRVLLLLG